MQTITKNQMRKAANPKHPASLSVAAVMSDIVMIYHYQKMSTVTDQLIQAESTCGVVVDGLENCVGVLTQTDIRNYYHLWNRYLDQDKSVLPKIFETNAFGLLRIDREYFHQVGKHMTSPVTTIASTSTCNDAMEIFDQNEEIHHLVVLNKSSKPIGVVSQNDLPIPTFDSPAYQIPQGL